jgi:FkbM family methyltransferase
MLKTSQKILIATLLSRIMLGGRKILGLGAQTVVTRHGVKWALDLNEGIDFSIYLLGAFEPLTQRQFPRFISSGDVVIDIGANIGAHTLPLAQMVGENGRVVAVEPTEYAAGKLLQSVALNEELRNRIEVRQRMLVSGVEEQIPGTIYSSWPLHATGDLHEEHKGRLMSTAGSEKSTLDELVDELKLDQVDALKLDVDGNEYSVLKGAARTLSKFHPVIFMELAPYVFHDGADFDGLIALLRSHGYQLTHISNGKKIPSDPVQIREMVPVGGSINVIAASAYAHP